MNLVAAPALPPKTWKTFLVRDFLRPWPRGINTSRSGCDTQGICGPQTAMSVGKLPVIPVKAYQVRTVWKMGEMSLVFLACRKFSAVRDLTCTLRCTARIIIANWSFRRIYSKVYREWNQFCIFRKDITTKLLFQARSNEMGDFTEKIIEQKIKLRKFSIKKVMWVFELWCMFKTLEI